jgi:hypothetical protein
MPLRLGTGTRSSWSSLARGGWGLVFETPATQEFKKDGVQVLR